jgi:hypothetical protein
LRKAGTLPPFLSCNKPRPHKRRPAKKSWQARCHVWA